MNNKNADIFLLLILFCGWVFLGYWLIIEHNQNIEHLQEIDRLKLEISYLKENK